MLSAILRSWETWVMLLPLVWARRTASSLGTNIVQVPQLHDTGVRSNCLCLHLGNPTIVTQTFSRNVQLFTTYPHSSNIIELDSTLLETGEKRYFRLFC